MIGFRLGRLAKRWHVAGLLLCASVLSLFTAAGPAVAAQWGDLLYTVEGGSEVTITGYAGGGGTLTIPPTIDGLPVTRIGDGAFDSRSELTGQVVIPDSVVLIGESAFCNCVSLTGVVLGNGVREIGGWAFMQCDGLSGEVVIPDSVISIGRQAFSRCEGLNALMLGKGVKEIGISAFNSCRALSGALTLPEGVTNIGDYAFYDCNGLTGRLTIPASVTRIGSCAFRRCLQLTGVKIGANVVSLGGGAFNECGGLKGDVMIPDGVPAIELSTFYGCTNLASVTVGSGVTNIGQYAFAICAQLSAVYFKGLPPQVEVGGFAGVPGTVYYVAGQPGWEAYLGGRPTAIWTSTAVFDAGEGTPAYASKVYNVGSAYGELPTASNPQHEFAGWWTELAGGTEVTAESLVPFVTGTHRLYARWSGGPVPKGVWFSMALPDAFAEVPKVSVSGLPSGLKFNAATRLIEGVPTQLGTYGIVISAPGVEAVTVTLTVEGLPVWAQGTFNGYAEGGGLASMSVSAAGKVTGKVTAGGANYTFAAASYARYDAYTETYWIETQAKAGKTVKPMQIGVCQPGGIDQWLGYAVPENVAVAESEGGVPLLMWRDVWKEVPETLALFSGYYTATLPGNGEYGSGYLTLTVDKAGKVKAAGKLADGTAVSMAGALLINGSGFVSAALYAAPSAYKGGMFFGGAEFVKPFDGEAFCGEVYLTCWDPVRWDNLNPQATAVYGAGFARETGIVGGWYGKTGNLYDYYRNKDLVAGVDTNAPVPELTVGTNRFASVCWSPAGLALTPVLKSGAMTGLAAPAAGKPVDPDKDGAWDYSAANSVGLKIALARPTGVFKGSFLAWFDYPEKKHVSKSLAFEGVLTPEREDPADGVEGRGFFLWADKAVISATGKTYPFKWSYDLKILLSE